VMLTAGSSPINKSKPRTTSPKVFI